MDVEWVSPSENLIEKVAEKLKGEKRDYSSNLVIFPGKRPSHFLRKFLATKEKTSLIPPLILSMDEFIEKVYMESFGWSGKKLEAIDAISILYDLHLDSTSHLGENRFLTPDTFFPIGIKLYNDLEELLIEAISSKKLKELDSLTNEKIPEPMVKRLQSLSYFFERFYKRVEEKHFSTLSMRYRAVAERIDGLNRSCFKRVIFAGFFALTESEKKIFRSLMKRDHTLFLFQWGEGIKKKLTDLGIIAQRKELLSEPILHFYKSPDAHGQVLGVSSLLKNKIDQREQVDENTVIVLPNPETLFPLLHHALNFLHPEDYNVSLSYPLQRTPLFSFFNNLMEAVSTMQGDRLYVPYYLKFILHPYTKNIYFQGKAEVTRILFHAMEETLTEKQTMKFLSLSELEGEEVIVKAVKEKGLQSEGISLNRIKDHLKTIHDHTIRKILSIENVGDFAKKMIEVIEYLYKNSTARFHPLFYPYSESFITQLDLLSKSLMKEIRFQEMGSYSALFKRYLSSSYTPFGGTPLKGVQVLGFLETRNLKFDRVIFLDVNEGILPDTTREDTFLPFKARQILGLPTYLDREEIMFYTFETLIRGAKEVHLFYIENSEKERSRFIEHLLWERQKRERERDDKKYIKTIRYIISLRDKRPQPIPKSKEMISFLKEYSFSATALNTYLSCPLQFYYEYVLGLIGKENFSEEFEREEIGLFVHRVLNHYFKLKIGTILSEKEIDTSEFKQIFNQQFQDQYGRDLGGEIYLLKKQMERHLSDFFKYYQVPKIKECPTKIIGLEQRIEVVKNSFKIGARLDRIEKRGDRTVIIDYKTSANKNSLAIRYHQLDMGNRNTWKEAIPTLQLPFYLTTYSSLTGEKPEEIDCLFLLLGRTRIDTEIEVPLFKNEKEFKEHFENLIQVIFTLLREIVNPDQPFQPTSDPMRNCGRCSYGHICTN